MSVENQNPVIGFIDRLSQNIESDIKYGDMRKIHEELCNSEENFFEDIPELIFYKFGENQGDVDSSRNEIRYFKNRGFLLCDDTYTTGSSYYFYKLKGFRVIWFEDGCIELVTLHTTSDSEGYTFAYESVDSINIFNKEISDDTDFEEYWTGSLDCIASEKTYPLILMKLVKLHREAIKTFPIDYLFTPPSNNELSLYSKKLTADISEYLISVCKECINGDISKVTYLRNCVQVLNEAEVEITSSSLLELITYVLNNKNTISDENTRKIVDILNQFNSRKVHDHSIEIIKLIDRLKETSKGGKEAHSYQKLIYESMKLIFDQQLSRAKYEDQIWGGQKRVDIVMDNTAKEGFFYRIKTDYKIHSPKIIIECKNYTNDPKNPELDQLTGRLDNNIGMFGMLLIRELKDDSALFEKCRRFFDKNQYVILYLTDKDVIYLLEMRKLLDFEGIDEFMMSKFERLIQS